MIPTPSPEQMTWLGMLAVLVGFLVRLLKTDALNTFLGRFGLPPIQKSALPWLALALGFAGSVLEAKTRGAEWMAALMAGVWGIVSGTVAVAGQETLPAVAGAIHPKVANVMFGKEMPAGKAPSVKPPPMMTLMLCLALAFGSVGCAAIASALPTVISAVVDGMSIIDQIQHFVDAYFANKPDKEKYEQVAHAIARCRSALNTANRIANGAEKLNQEKVDDAFTDFRVAYQELMVLVGPLGVVPADALGVDPYGRKLYVPEPEAFKLKVSR